MKALNPGVATMMLILIPVGAYYIWYVASHFSLEWWYYVAAGVLLLPVSFCSLMLPIKLLADKDSKYAWPQVDAVIKGWLEKKRQQAIDADSHAMDTLRRRAAVIGFRAGMLCYLLENHKWTKTVGSFAEWVAEYVFRNQMEIWGEQVDQTYKRSLEAQTERGAAASLLALLPDEFTAADLIHLRARKGQSVKSSAISMVLNRWRANNRIEKINETTWRKF